MSKLFEAIKAEDHAAGNPEATVTLVEYGDYECPHCGRAHPIVQRILAEFGADIKFVFRNFPLSEIHPHAVRAAAAAEFASGQGKFWEMHDTIFENQRALDDSHLAAYGSRLGLDPVDLVTALEDETILGRIEHDFMTGIRSGVNGTPTFFLNGTRFDAPWDYEFLAMALREALDRA